MRKTPRSPLALAILALCPLAPAQDIIQVAVREGQSFAGVTGAITRIQQTNIGANGGWAVIVDLDGAGGGPASAIVGSLAPDFTAAPVVLRIPETLAGVAQLRFLSVAIADGAIFYGVTDQALASANSLWRDDELLHSAGDTVGTSPLTWRSFETPHPFIGGGYFVKGTALTPAGNLVDLIVEYPTGNIVLQRGDTAPGFGDEVSFLYDFDVSPSGNHWAVVAGGENLQAQAAIIVDGAVLQLPEGQLARSQSDVPVQIGGDDPALRWSSFLRVRINDEGTYAFSGNAEDATAPFRVLRVRNGLRMDHEVLGSAEAPAVVGLDERGFVTGSLRDLDPTLGSRALVPVQPRLDIDFDGVADPEWIRVTSGAVAQYFALIGPSSEALVRARLRNTVTGEQSAAVFHVGRYDLGRAFCPNVPNSRGEPARMIAQRSDVVSTNRLILQCEGLPANSSGYFLLSRSMGFAAQPGGSQGNLCLGGSIGRLTDQVFNTGVVGRASVRLDLTALPTPAGPISAAAGETWYSQTWFRDSVSGAATSNFSDAMAVLLR